MLPWFLPTHSIGVLMHHDCSSAVRGYEQVRESTSKWGESWFWLTGAQVLQEPLSIGHSLRALQSAVVLRATIWDWLVFLMFSLRCRLWMCPNPSLAEQLVNETTHVVSFTLDSGSHGSETFKCLLVCRDLENFTRHVVACGVLLYHTTHWVFAFWNWSHFGGFAAGWLSKY